MFNKKTIYFVFFLSGLSGLIYELLWSHYLKTFLGHSAYAQSLVLCIFMGGMAVGSFLSSKFSNKIKHPLMVYAIIEGFIGFFALIFHYLFNGVVSISYNYVFPWIENSLGIIIYKIIISSLIITPQTILLGMTFPIMSYFFVRDNQEDTGKSVAILYFFNSIGAAFGVFISGFYLVENLGMPFTMAVGGIINLLIFLYIFFNGKKIIAVEPPLINREEYENKKIFTVLFFVAFGTAFSSFIYEIVWIRMLILVLGGSTHNFEIMLCAFITGLAFGGLYIRLKAGSIKNPLSYLAAVQVLMGISAISTLPFYNITFSLISYLIGNLPKNEFGYYLFNLSSHLISFLIMLPATFLAGMTFPLIILAMNKEGYGEKSIGYVYSINTMGAIIGIIFAVHIGFPFLGLKNLLFFGAVIDVALGLGIIFIFNVSLKPVFSPKLVTGTSTSILLLGFFLINLDSYKLSSGVYREGIIFNPRDYKLYFYEDGKTASISVVGDREYLSIRTNGKSDSAIALDERLTPSADEYTCILASVIPYLYKPDSQNVAVIGLGTGLTTQTALLNPSVKEVDTIEIEKEVVTGAKIFLNRNYGVFKDKRSKIYIDDAKTFFTTHRHKYDIIISEPSNPWISGVSALFSNEFYSIVRNYLNEGGILVQWIQLYEIDIPHIASIIKAISKNFADYALYVTTENEMLIVSSNNPLGCLNDNILKDPQMYRVLKRLNMTTLADFQLRKIGEKKYFDSFFHSFDVRENSDFYPILERKAPKLRFFGLGAGQIINLITGPIPITKILMDDIMSTEDINLTPYFQRPYLIKIAFGLRDILLDGKTE
ncbi:MAG: spermidine synthase, partial [Proteobacteria bacterium]|nr:spermidine synthase [Pseudomonadota bacterium]